MRYLKPNVEYLERDIDSRLLDWKNDTWHHALVIVGARQVGKTTSILHFANGNYKYVVYLNLDEADGKNFIEFVKRTPKKVDKLLNEYFTLNSIPYTNSSETVIIFDEIQNSEIIWSLIRPIDTMLDCDLIVTGSALSETKTWFIPAGNFETVKMHTMSFPEFLRCNGVRELYDNYDIEKLTKEDAAWFNQAFNVYCKVGGYPAAVLAFLHKTDYKKPLAQLLEVLKKEMNNKSKFEITKERVERLLKVIIRSLLQEKKGDKNLLEHLVLYANGREPSIKTSKAEVSALIDWLAEVDVLSIYDGVNLATNTIMEGQRIYFNDVGFLNYLLETNNVDSGNAIGVISENFVHKAFYNKDLNNISIYFGIYNNYEFDFVLFSNETGKNKIIEVKHKGGRSESMEFAIKHNLADYYSFYMGNSTVKRDGNVSNIPIYFIDKTITDDLTKEKSSTDFDLLPPFPTTKSMDLF